MNTIGSGPGILPQTISPYSPVARPAVGLESAEDKVQALPPVEESAASDKNRGQTTDDKVEGATPDGRGGKGRQGEQSAAELTDEERDQVRELAANDRKVRAHEAAHQAVGGSLAGGASFRFQTGPDGLRYAVGGEVPISLAESSDPETTLRNAEQVQAAALAPAQPSPQDRQVAATGARMAVEARLQLALAQTAPQEGEARPAAALDSFGQNAGENLPPGSLLDQRT